MFSTLLVVVGVLVLVAGVAAATVTRRAYDARREAAREQRDREAADRRDRAKGLEIELAKIATVDAEYEATAERLAEMLRSDDTSPQGISQALAVYDEQVRAHTSRIDAERRRRQAEAELDTLLNGGSLEQVQQRCAELERSLNGHRNAAGATRSRRHRRMSFTGCGRRLGRQRLTRAACGPPPPSGCGWCRTRGRCKNSWMQPRTS